MMNSSNGYGMKDLQILRIAVSDIAAIADYNPWSSPIDCFQKYLYQDLPHILETDAKCLGLVVATKDDEILEIFQKLKSEDRTQLHSLHIALQCKDAVVDSNHAKDLLVAVEDILKKSSVTTTLSQADFTLLEDEFKSKVCTSYGKTCESSVLDAYENMTGFAVDGRNDVLLVWPVLRDEEYLDLDLKAVPGTITERFNRFRNTKTSPLMQLTTEVMDFSTEQESIVQNMILSPHNDHEEEDEDEVVAVAVAVAGDCVHDDERESFPLSPRLAITAASVVCETHILISNIQSLICYNHHYRDNNCICDSCSCSSGRNCYCCCSSAVGNICSTSLSYSSRTKGFMALNCDAEAVFTLLIDMLERIAHSQSHTNTDMYTDTNTHMYTHTEMDLGEGRYTKNNDDFMSHGCIRNIDNKVEIQRVFGCMNTNTVRDDDVEADDDDDDDLDGDGKRKRRRVKGQSELSGTVSIFTRIFELDDLAAAEEHNSDDDNDNDDDGHILREFVSGYRALNRFAFQCCMLKPLLMRGASGKTYNHGNGNRHRDKGGRGSGRRRGYRVLVWSIVTMPMAMTMAMDGNEIASRKCNDCKTADDIITTAHVSRNNGMCTDIVVPTVVKEMGVEKMKVNKKEAEVDYEEKANDRDVVLFYIIGMVDGISGQMDMSSDDAQLWRPVKVLVEVKNRVHRIQSHPALHEQIQLCTYMIMTGCELGDLVQCISSSNGESPSSSQTTTTSTTSSSSLPVSVSKSKSVSFPTISRMSLHGPPFHGHNFLSTILPALKSFENAIQLVRRDDGLRYMWLLADEQLQRQMLQEWCPHLGQQNMASMKRSQQSHLKR